MFAKLKKKIAEEAATVPRTGGRLPRTVSKESITSAGADSGDDFASDGSSSRDDLSSQLLRRNDQIRKLEAKLSDYAEQLRLLQKTKEKLEIALEKHQDSSMRKLQEQNEAYQTSRAKMAEGMTLALEKKDQEWRDKIAGLEQEKATLTSRLDDMMEQSLNLFKKRDDIDELEGFQQQELAKLLRKEEALSQRERELERHGQELRKAREELGQARARRETLEEEQQQCRSHNAQLRAEREELLGVKQEAEKKITELEKRGQELQTVIQHVSEDFQKAQSMASLLEKTLATLQAEHESLKLQHEQHKLKAMVAAEEKDKLIVHLQEKVSALERRFEENFSEDEHVQELLKEKSALRQKVEETRAQLLKTRTDHSDTVSLLETQIAKLNSKVAEVQTLLQHKDESARLLQDRSKAQVSELEQQIQDCSERLKKSEQQTADKEAHIQKLRAEHEAESSRLQQQISAGRQQSAEKVSRLEAQVGALEVAREIDRTAAQHKMSQLEQENESLKASRLEMENTVRRREEELEGAKAELSSRQTVSVEIAKALEETRKQKEELQEQVLEFTAALNAKEQSLLEKTEELGKQGEEMTALREELHAAQTRLAELQAEMEKQQGSAADRERDAGTQLSSLRQEVLTQTQQLEACQSQVADLEEEVQTLHGRLRAQVDCGKEQNGAVTADDVAHVQKMNRELEQQLAEKNKMIKQLQQRMSELKRTLQKELRLKPDAEGAEGRERPCAEAPAASATVTNNSDLNDSREINFEYLKHVVLKFMSSSDAEAYQLIKAVSVLLNFTREEENMLKETLEYKMSWFGSKPAPKGIVRPSISGAPAHWS
ncbi:golgin subfamily A member 1 isoform X2 [Lepisosteus oculatus]|uniref:golgin subfamily A member 1 isoform X2 n=1 Tax=Lepisosteus oculatus TaxID=7918 RepID=UPI003714E876